MGNCIAYNLITIDQGRAFLQKAPYCAPLMTLILVPFIGAKNVAFLKVSFPPKIRKNTNRHVRINLGISFISLI